METCFEATEVLGAYGGQIRSQHQDFGFERKHRDGAGILLLLAISTYDGSAT